MEKLKLNIQKFGANVSISGSDGDVNVSANTSYINGSITISTNGSTYNNEGSAYYTINGGGPNYFSIGQNSSKTFGYRLGPYTHNNDGSLGNQSVSAYVRVTSSTSTSGSISVPMQTIPRYAHTDSASGSNIEENFSVNYTKYVSSYQYKLRISIPNVRALERIDYNTSGTSFKLSQATIDDLFNTYGPSATFNLGFAVETWNNGSVQSGGNEVIISCKTDSKGRIRINNEWKNATPYIRASGQWKKTTPYVRINNEWKRGK